MGGSSHGGGGGCVCVWRRDCGVGDGGTAPRAGRGLFEAQPVASWESARRCPAAPQGRRGKAPYAGASKQSRLRRGHSSQTRGLARPEGRGQAPLRVDTQSAVYSVRPSTRLSSPSVAPPAMQAATAAASAAEPAACIQAGNAGKHTSYQQLVWQACLRRPEPSANPHAKHSTAGAWGEARPARRAQHAHPTGRHAPAGTSGTAGGS